MKKIAKSVLEKIRREKICPRARLFFVLKNFFVFCGGILFLLFGIFPAAAIFFAFENLEILDFLLHGPRIFLKIIFVGLPIFWIFLWIFFGFLATNFFRKTKKLYKISTTFFLIFIFCGQIFGGFFLKNSEFVENFEEKTAHHIFIKSVRDRRDAIWHRPDDGFLLGKFEKFDGENLLVKSPDKKIWRVEISTKIKKILEKIPHKKLRKVRIIGEKIDEKNFRAEKILPPRPRKFRPKNFKNEKNAREKNFENFSPPDFRREF